VKWRACVGFEGKEQNRERRLDTSALKMETARYSETLTLTYETMQRQSQEQHKHDTNRSENLKVCFYIATHS
jgi:hypothetical protein